MAKKRSLKIFNSIDLHSNVPYFNFLNPKILCNWNVYICRYWYLRKAQSCVFIIQRFKSFSFLFSLSKFYVASYENLQPLEWKKSLLLQSIWPFHILKRKSHSKIVLFCNHLTANSIWRNLISKIFYLYKIMLCWNL